MQKQFHAVNWNNVKSDDYVMVFWEQNLKQFWIDTEFVPSKDIKVWNRLSQIERDTYMKVLGGLTLLDTEQNTVGMPKILDHINDLAKKSVLSFMGMMEGIHAKSYSTIFTTLATKEEIDDVFDWVAENKYLQKKVSIIDKYYRNIETKKDLYMAIVASVFLESFLFYSGFFYPLYLAGQGKMVASGEIINLIIRDESVHGLFGGLLGQEVYTELSKEEKEEVDNLVYCLLDELMDNEIGYTQEIYSGINLDNEVKSFLKYNANKALMNLGREVYYKEEKINPIVLNGLSTETKTFDFFSNKGNGYQKGKVAPVTDDTFAFVNNLLNK
ncbi:class 1b ribonucleoside-diphosphate reductase subunit beta [Brevibacillus laterosporus]|uniref:class 1b ribonucleoside-diphosphate reductase subunit beta n=1 Tax=Brevibacillus laterosporus TaxID=1465 RepID=UPI00215B960F|nr:class 1b ribonucleoside-diphosphate reductase subunit beta [Brevibacillus laterosporus]MCR8994560.1 class 1b ribonucleoside-diphosphate reductase subunit beta [Brevibacillus laterosporus]